MTLIGLIDRIRMMDNDLIRLNTKLNMILQQQDNVQMPTDEEVDAVIKRIKSEQR